MTHILLIDDELSVRRPLALFLAKAGYEVSQAGDGREGMQLWRDDPADLVITDLHMPGQNGLEIIAQLRALAPDVPIILISGDGEAHEELLPRDLHSRSRLRVVPKPFKLSELLTAVREALSESACLASPSRVQRST